VPTDDRGYLPVARKENSYPPTGDPKVDAVKSAFMIFSVTNPVEVENLNKCTYVSMGTFVLPNGKIVFALFVPLEVRGRRWGTLGVGLLPKALGLH
jgi:methyl-accepting chemotaxis protein